VDLLWPERQLVVELDGFAFHVSPIAFERDPRRDADLQARGFRVLRFTWRQVTREPALVAARIGSLCARPR
jgi:very-short-patch-repair endonuclease